MALPNAFMDCSERSIGMPPVLIIGAVDRIVALPTQPKHLAGSGGIREGSGSWLDGMVGLSLSVLHCSLQWVLSAMPWQLMDHHAMQSSHRRPAR